jgi:aspartyl protease family protein
LHYQVAGKPSAAYAALGPFSPSHGYLAAAQSRQAAKAMVRTFIAAAAMLGIGVLSVRYLDEPHRAPPASVRVAASEASAPANSRAMVIKASQGGHFAVDARVDGRRLAFMVDTGASQVAIRASDAARLGFHPRERDYTVRIHTANGEGRAALVELRMVEVGDIVVRDLRALVLPDQALNVNLLGMSFLSRVRWSHERGRLTLEQ